ncbi:MAG: hypothetical protein FWD55_02530, partial [Propionibacteriaceae bacterium]|nr:hypothetical protein [Propionibacteriaceae bacterium]
MKVEWKPFGGLCTLGRTPIDIIPEATYLKAGVRSFGKGIFDYEPMPGAEIGKLRFHPLEANRLVFSNIKAWEGAVAVTGNDEEGRVVSNRFLTYRASDEVVLRYLLHWFLSTHGNATLQMASPGSADRNRTLSINALERILVPIPSRPDQDRIAAHLDSLGIAAHVAPTTNLDAAIERLILEAASDAPRVRLSSIL